MEEKEWPSREMGVAFIVVGVVLALISGLAESVGIGGGTFGWKQMVGVAVGCLIAAFGLFVVFHLSRATNSQDRSI